MNRQFLSICITGIIVFTGCAHDHNNHSEEADGTDTHAIKEDTHEHKNSDIIVMDHDKAEAAGLKVEEIKPGTFAGILPTGGKILTASGNETTVVATVSGIVSFSRPVTEGMAVSKGAPLFSISSSKLPDGDITQRARIDYTKAKAEYERAESLIKDRIITEKEFLEAKAAYENAELAYKAIGGKNGSKGVSVTSPAGGYVKECLVKEGDFVEVGAPLMSVTQNKSLYLRAEVPERDYKFLNQISSAKFKPSYSDAVYDIKELNGRLMSFGKTSGETSFFIPVTFEFDNTGGIIPGTFAEVFLVIGQRNNVISVPKSALTEEQGVYYVYIQEDPDCYNKREVKIGSTDGQRTEITSGLHAGEKVVTEGAIHVKLAGAGKSIPGHTHNH